MREIYIRNFNKFPNFNIKINLAIFIEEIAFKAQQIFSSYFSLLKEQDSKIKLPKAQIKILDRNFCSFLTLISGLLLSIEQFTYNKTNPQIAFTTSSFVMLNAEDSHYSENGQKPLENSKFISEEALTNVIKWTELWNLDSTPLSIKYRISLIILYYIFLKKVNFTSNCFSDIGIGKRDVTFKIKWNYRSFNKILQKIRSLGRR